MIGSGKRAESNSHLIFPRTRVTGYGGRGRSLRLQLCCFEGGSVANLVSKVINESAGARRAEVVDGAVDRLACQWRHDLLEYLASFSKGDK